MIRIFYNSNRRYNCFLISIRTSSQAANFKKDEVLSNKTTVGQTFGNKSVKNTVTRDILKRLDISNFNSYFRNLFNKGVPTYSGIFPAARLKMYSFMFIRGCLKTAVTFFGITYLLTDSITYFFPVGIIIIALFAIGVHFTHVPPPKSKIVECIMGKDPALVSDDNDDDVHLIKTIAHRGAGLDAPENSLTAFKLCKEKGVDFIEFDVTLTADCVPVVFHDDTLERMAGLQECINDMPYAELQRVDISAKHPFKEKFHGTKIPTLDETVKQLLNSEQNMFIDVKDNNMEMVSVILNIYESYPELYTKAITTSFFPNIIYMIRKRNPRIVCSLAWRPYPFTHTSYSYATGKGSRRAKVFYMHYLFCFFDWLHELLLMNVTYYMTGISFILLHKDVISGRVVRDWRERGVRVIAWTANHPVEKQHLARVLKVTYMTDTLTGESTIHSQGTNHVHS